MDVHIGLQTPIHRAVYASQERILNIYINIREKNVQPNFNLQDEHGQSVFSLTLWMNMLTIAKQLLQIGQAEINIKDSEQTPLLAQAIIKQNVPAALFLLEQNVDANEKTHGLCPIQLAVKYHLPSVIEALCRNGANMNVMDENGNSVLWNALDSGQEDIATILVKFGCDSTQYVIGVISSKIRHFCLFLDGQMDLIIADKHYYIERSMKIMRVLLVF
jgi:ankyrin repeat protein